MSKKRHVPIRMCIGCRRKKKKDEMLRFAQTIDGVVVADKKKRMNGRGLYLCPDLVCFKMAQKKRGGGDCIGSMDYRYPFMKGLK
jgi:predicted RNA-binding protein YlxR (DUF448 family)